jgi:Na+/melibiose symporter-like transporter
MPDQVATITGLRGMFRNMGGAISIAIATLILESISDVNQAFFIIFISLTLILLLSIPAIFVMPGSPNTKAPLYKSSKE